MDREGINTMKLVTPTGDEMIEVRSLSTAAEGIVMNVNVMKSMQMSVVLTPTELRKGLAMLTWRMIVVTITMLFRR